uniref:Uncharacterized protein n=1 Tax=Panagrolaimus sp. ES5 TaxID=591445 RepID=A0AC34GQU4_9BILA
MPDLKYQYVILSDPPSFDFRLSASVKQEQIKKKLQNGITLPNGIGADETFKFVGQTFKTSKSPWLAFSCTYNNGSTMKFQIYFDLKNSKLVSKMITVVSKAQKTKQLNETWTNPTGGQISIALKNINPGFQLSVNDVVYSKLLNDKSIKNVNLVTYGSNWTMNSASIVDTSGKTNALKMLPTFYSDLVPINFSKLKGNSKNLKLLAQEIDFSTNQQETKMLMNTVNQNRITNYEFRASKNPQSDLVKMQFQYMPSPSNAQYIIFWKRIKSVWSTSGVVFLNKGSICTSYEIGVTLNGVNFYCGDVLAHNISYPNYGSTVKFQIQNDAHPSACPASDPYQRMLFRFLPRITDYSF